MAITNKAAIQALIDAYTANITLYITSNNNKEITGAQLKQILDESSVILEDLKDSYFNLLDEPRTALSVSFTALNALDWDVLPTEVKAGLDELASRTRIIENSLPIVKEFEFFFNTSSPTSNEVPSYGTVDIFGTERQDGSITSVEYETSTDKINWTNRGNLTGGSSLASFMIGATSTTFLWIRAVNPVTTGLGEKGFIVQYN